MRNTTHWLVIVIVAVSTAVVAARISALVERTSSLRAALTGLTTPRAHDFRETLIANVSGIADERPAGQVHVLVIVGRRTDWSSSLTSVISSVAAYNTQRSSPNPVSVTIVATKDARDTIAEATRQFAGVSVVGVSNAASFSRHTGIDYVPYTLVLGDEAGVVAAFDGVWPSASELGDSLSRANADSAVYGEILIRRGIPAERLAAAEPTKPL